MEPFVFVTVGNGREPFPRLLLAIDRLAGEGVFAPAEVLMQSGNDNGYRAKHCRQEQFLPMEQFAEAICNARLVIAHAGAGTLFHLLQAGKIPVVMPRRSFFDECVDDHQVELVQVLSNDGRVVPALSPENLPAAITEARQRTMQQRPVVPARMLSLVARAVDEIMRN